ncbi:MAG: ATP-dependent Clp protease ATP-binding subunit [Bacilli bacterium]|nr:ATP-dependent Clp protease ATP-binding subunit [Bacilli bacterium]
MFSKFDEDAQRVLVGAKKEMMDLNHPYVGSEHLVLSMLKNDNSISKKLRSFHLDYSKFKNEILNIIGTGSKKSEWFLYTPLLKRVIENAILDSKENNDGEVSVEHLFSALLEEGEGIAIRLFISMDIDIDELYKDFSKRLVKPSKNKKNKKLLLTELGTDLTECAKKGNLDPVIGRDIEIKRVIEILSRRTKNNPVLVGEAGVGKTAIVEGLARMIVSGEVPNHLKNKRIISLDMASTVAGTKYRGEFEERVRKILKEIEENDDIILFIDEIHTIVGAGGAEGAIDASNILKPSLARGKIRLIGATTIEEYKKFIEEDSALERRLQKVSVEIPTKDTVKNILYTLKPIYESYHGVVLNDNILDDIIKYSEKYIYDRNEPDRSIDILDEVCARVSIEETKEVKKINLLKKELSKVINEKNKFILEQDFDSASTLKEKEYKLNNDINKLELKLYSTKIVKEVTKDDILNVISIKTKIPIYEISNNNLKYIDEFKEKLNSRVIGQEEAINKLICTTKKIKLGLKEENKPYSYLFVGPTGVGKTDLVKQYTKLFYGKENLIRLDMSEYGESHTISKIIGSAPGYVGYSDNKNILEKVKNKPNSVILLDEIEKAHPKVLNIFLQILDEGFITDSKGSKIRFDNTIIIMTSNIGYNKITVGFEKHDENILTDLKDFLSIEFINRIDNIITFNKLSKDNIITIINNNISKLKEKYKKKGINISYNKNIIDELLELSNYEELGARQISKIIKDKFENIIIDKILMGEHKINVSSIKNVIV